ncbi:ABC transporter substrate-binding protein [Streptomyces thinghirensis]|nr:ABC transporter substrate-binding protein [Streptomyces thinghirensis]
MASQLTHVRNGNRRYDVTVAVRDSRSDPRRARQAVHDLVTTDQARIVLTMAGTQVLPAVADACEAPRVPCLSTTFPWQVYVHARGAAPGHALRWTYHFAWGLDDIATVFARMWSRSTALTPSAACGTTTSKAPCSATTSTASCR